MSHDPVFECELQSHIDTWAAHCGAPKAVYIGHLKLLLQACVEQCARVAEASGNEAETLIASEIARKIREVCI